MKQEIIKVILSQQGKNDILTFQIPDQDDASKYFVNLSDSAKSQTQLKLIFSKLLTLLIERDITLKLEIEKDFTRTLQREVSEEYIKDLNTELKNIKEIMSEQQNIEDANSPTLTENTDGGW